ncbi:unnamed protein product [marine sediment metagenome]|uniref:Uncharacterized protein n=1 Tax=marine sediment metagenome TaxID=412755 RepID=X1UC10_9ZZZZ
MVGCQDGEITSIDFKFNDFVDAIYKQEPGEPFAYRLEFLDQIDKEELRKLLAYFVITGAKTKYEKELAQLSPDEIKYLRQYLISIGYNVKFEVQQKMQKLDPKNPQKETAVNYFMIDFFSADPALDKNNVARPMI